MSDVAEKNYKYQLKKFESEGKELVYIAAHTDDPDDYVSGVYLFDGENWVIDAYVEGLHLPDLLTEKQVFSLSMFNRLP